MSNAVIDQLVERVAKNKTQAAVVTKALREYDLLVQAERPEGQPLTGRPQLLQPLADTVVFVLSGEGTSDRDVAELRARLAYTVEKKGPVHVVTVGRRGVEEAARAWCAQQHMPYSEVAAIWAIPQPDGTTLRNPNARNPRNQKLREFCTRVVADGKLPLVWVWGKERDNDAVEGVLVKAGAFPRMGSPLWRADKHDLRVQAPAEPVASEPEPSIEL